MLEFDQVMRIRGQTLFIFTACVVAAVLLYLLQQESVFAYLAILAGIAQLVGFSLRDMFDKKSSEIASRETKEDLVRKEEILDDNHAPMKPLRVFLSSTMEDLEDERKAVIDALLKKQDELRIVAMEHWVSTNRRPKQVCLDELQKSDVYVGMIGFLYGSIDKETGKSITQLEYELAKEKDIPRLIFLKSDKALVKACFVEQDPRKIELLKSFKEQIDEERFRDTFVDPNDLAKQVVVALDRLQADLISRHVRPRELAPDLQELKRRVLRISEHSFNGLETFTERYDGKRRPGKYSPEIYVERARIEKGFDNFIDDKETTGFILVADSGLGKTNLFCRKYEQHRDHDMVLFYSSTYSKYITTHDIRNRILEDLGLSGVRSGSQDFYETLSSIGKRCSEAGMRFIIIFDAINEHKDPRELMSDINAMIGLCKEPYVKIAASCRTESWRTIGHHLSPHKVFADGVSPYWTLSEFDRELLARAYDKYKKVYEISTPDNKLPKKAEDFLLRKRANPLMLRFISEAYDSESIPSQAPDRDVFELYYRKKIQVDDKVARFFERLVQAMIDCRSATPTIANLSGDLDLSRELRDPSENSPYRRLKDLTVLYERGEFAAEKQVVFYYEKFFEFALATRLFPREKYLTTEDFLRWINEGRKFKSVWGAVKAALIDRKDWKIIDSLSRSDNMYVRTVVVETLAELGGAESTRKDTERYLEKVLKEGVRSQKILAARVLSEIYPCPVGLFANLVLDDDEDISLIAMQYAYLLWKKSRIDGRALVKELHRRGLDLIAIPPKVSPKAFRRSYQLQTMIFFNHYLDEDAIDLVNDIAREGWLWTLKFPGLSKIIHPLVLREGTELVKDMFSMVFDTDFNVFFDTFFRGASEKERTAFRLLAEHIEPKSSLSEIRDDLLYATREVALSEGVVKLALGTHARIDPKTVESILRKMMSSDYPHSREVSLQVLAYATIVNPDFIEMINEIQKAVKTIPNFEALYKGIGELAFAICATHSRKITRLDVFFEIVESAASEGDATILHASLKSLASVGIRYPEIVLETLRPIVAYEGTCRPDLVECLAKIRLVHTDMVDGFLEEYPSIQADVAGLEVTLPYGEWFGIKSFIFNFVTDFDEYRSLLVDFIQRISYVHSDEEFKAFVEYCFDKSINAWDDPQAVPRYREWAKRKKEAGMT